MTRKDYTALAAIMRTARKWATEWPEGNIFNFIEDEISAYCYHQNENFDRQRFLDACFSEDA